MTQLTKVEMQLLKQCDGKHDTMQEIIDCASCTVLLK